MNRPLERKNEHDGPDDVKSAVNTVMTAFEEFKTANDARLKEIEKKGSADPLLDDKLNRINSTLDKYEGMNQKLVQLELRQKALDDHEERFDKIETALERLPINEPGTKSDPLYIENWARAVISAHTNGIPNLSEVEQKALSRPRDEFKALSVTPDTAGGYLAPMEYVREITKTVTEMSPVRSLARVRQTAMKAIEVPKRTGQFAAQWVTEQGTKSETTGLAYGLDTIPTHEFYALIDISNQMLEDSVFSMESEISMESAEQFAVAEGAAFVSGTGVGKPEGFLQNADVLTTFSGTAATIADADGQANGLLTLKYLLKTFYARNATWLLNRTTMGSVRKLKDGDKNYIWMPGIAQGRPNTIDGDPYVEVPDMPNEGAGNKPIAYGDFRRAYTWVDRITMEMLRDPYTQATAGNIRFIMRKRVGGRVLLPEAIKILRCATS